MELQLYGHEAGGVASRNGPPQSLDGRDGEPTEEECTGSTVVRQPTIEPQVGSQLWLGAGEDGQVDGSGRQDAGAERANSRRDEYIEIFRQIDGNGDGQISQIEFIRALRRDSALALKLGLPHVIHQEDESRRLFESTFHELDADNSKTISLSEWLRFYCPGHTADINSGSSSPDAMLYEHVSSVQAFSTSSSLPQQHSLSTDVSAPLVFATRKPPLSPRFSGGEGTHIKSRPGRDKASAKPHEESGATDLPTSRSLRIVGCASA